MGILLPRPKVASTLPILTSGCGTCQGWPLPAGFRRTAVKRPARLPAGLAGNEHDLVDHVAFQDRQERSHLLLVVAVHESAGLPLADRPTVLLPLPLGTGGASSWSPAARSPARRGVRSYSRATSACRRSSCSSGVIFSPFHRRETEAHRLGVRLFDAKRIWPLLLHPRPRRVEEQCGPAADIEINRNWRVAPSAKGCRHANRRRTRTRARRK